MGMGRRWQVMCLKALDMNEIVASLNPPIKAVMECSICGDSLRGVCFHLGL